MLRERFKLTKSIKSLNYIPLLPKRILIQTMIRKPVHLLLDDFASFNWSLYDLHIRSEGVMCLLLKVCCLALEKLEGRCLILNVQEEATLQKVRARG
jgi:hypothetical protein